jgi:hypothetical protein
MYENEIANCSMCSRSFTGHEAAYIKAWYNEEHTCYHCKVKITKELNGFYKGTNFKNK